MQHIVLSLLLASAHKNACNQDDGLIPPDYNHVSDYAPFYEIDPHWDFNDNELISEIRKQHEKLGRRVFNTHLRWDMLPLPSNSDSLESDENKNHTPKFIYIIRSPLDACVSFYHHLSNQKEGQYVHSFEKFFEDWCDGKIAFGAWKDHVASFICNEKKQRSVLFVFYEDLVRDISSEVSRISQFLELNLEEEDRMRLLLSFSFDSMRIESNLSKFQPKSVTWIGEYKFLRKGVVGDFSSLISNEQALKFKTTFNGVQEWLVDEKETTMQTHIIKRYNLVQASRDS